MSHCDVGHLSMHLIRSFVLFYPSHGYAILLIANGLRVCIHGRYMLRVQTIMGATTFSNNSVSDIANGGSNNKKDGSSSGFDNGGGAVWVRFSADCNYQVCGLI